jgi:hypothetical protein
MNALITAAVLLFSATTALAQTFTPEIQGVPTHRILQQPSVTTPAPSSCGALLLLRHEAREATRQGQVWTPEQEAIGRAWKAQCDTKEWASRLAAMAPKDCTGDCGAGRPPGYYLPYIPPYQPMTTTCFFGRYFSSCTTR